MKKRMSLVAAAVSAAFMFTTAAFAQCGDTITVAIVGPGGYSANPASRQVVNGKPVTLTAKPDKDAVFVHWSNGEFTPTIKADDTCFTYTAVFRLKAECETPELTLFKKSHEAMVGVPFEAYFSVQDNAYPVKFSATKLPPGVKIDPVYGVVSGSPTKAGTYKGATVKATSVADPKKFATLTSPPIVVQPLPANIVGTYNGSVWHNVEERIIGSITATISATGKITAKAVTTDGTFSFSAPSFRGKWGNEFGIFAETPKGQALNLTLDSNNAWNNWQVAGSLSINGASYWVSMQRNPFINTKDATRAAAFAELAPFNKQYYTLALEPDGFVAGSLGNANNRPDGNGYLTFTVSDKGVAKFAGKLADGTSVSASTTLLMLGSVWVESFIPLYSKQGFVSGSLGFSDGKLANDWGTYFYWRYPGKSPTAKVPATEDRFTMWLKTTGGRYSPVASLWNHYAGKSLKVFELSPIPVLEGTKGAVKLPVGKAPVFDKVGNVFNYDHASDNPNRASLTVNAKTGLFSGKVTDYDEYTDAKGVRKLKSSSLSYSGVLLQINGVYSAKGYYLFPEDYADPANPKFKYNLKSSRPVSIE